MEAKVLSTQVGSSFKSDDSPFKGQDYYGNKVIVEKLESCRSDIQSYLVKYGISGVKTLDALQTYQNLTSYLTGLEDLILP